MHFVTLPEGYAYAILRRACGGLYEKHISVELRVVYRMFVRVPKQTAPGHHAVVVQIAKTEQVS